MSRFSIAGLSVTLFVAAGLLSIPKQPESKPTKTGTRAFGAIQPRLSPDGERVVFSYQGAIWTMPVGGTTMKRVSSGDGLDIEPCWSPDGTRIAYISTRNFNNGTLRVVDSESGMSVELAKEAQVVGKLHFHPDGKRILGCFAASNSTLAWFDIESGKTTPAYQTTLSARKSALSPDGKWIAFATSQDVPGQQGGNDGPQADLWKVSAEGGKPEKIVQFPSRIHDLCWENDRNVIVSSDVGGAHNDLWRVPLDGSLRGAERITNGQADEDRPSVSKHWLLYTDNRDGATALIRRDLRNGSEEPLAMRQPIFTPRDGSVTIQVIDKATRKEIPARVSVMDKTGKFYAPIGALYRLDRGNGHYYSTGGHDFMDLPSHEFKLIVSRGPEYKTVRRTFTVTEAEVAGITVELERWVDAAQFNLYSGENHIHANYGYGEWFNTPKTMLAQCEGEDLNVCNFMVANSDGDGVFDRPYFRGKPDPLSNRRTILYWNEEYRSTIWGHMTLLNLKHLVEPIFTGFKDTTNPYDTPTNADSAQRTREQGGLASYTHTAQNANDPYLGAYTGKGIPIDAALGKIDSLDINNSYAGSVPLWYRLLNCGFKLPASAGTDVFLNRIQSRLPGCDRCYVRIDGELTYEKWIDGLRAGRSFVTNGPMLEIIADGKHRQGETVRLAGPGKLKLVAKCWWQHPLRKVEIVLNGKVIETKELPADRAPEEVWQLDVNVETSGWIAVRTSGPAHADNPGGEAYAHTSPIYIDVPNVPQPAKADAEYFLKWIDRLDVTLRERNRYPTPAHRAHVASQLEAARAVYTKIAAR